MGAETVPVNEGEAIGAFEFIAVLFEEILAVFDATFVFSVAKSEAIEVMLCVFVFRLLVSVVKSVAFAFNAKAVVTSAVFAFNAKDVVTSAVFAFNAKAVVTSAVFAFKANPGTEGAAAVPERSPAN